MPTYPQGKVVVVRVGLELVELVEPVVLVLQHYSVVDGLRVGRGVGGGVGGRKEERKMERATYLAERKRTQRIVRLRTTCYTFFQGL